MGCSKLLFLLLLLSSYHLLRLPPACSLSLKHPKLTGRAHAKLVSVDRRGGGGGHGGGGHGSSRGGNAEGGVRGGHGEDSSSMQGGSVVPLYGAAVASRHHPSNNHHNHGALGATFNYSGLSFLVFFTLMVLVLV